MGTAGQPSARPVAATITATPLDGRADVVWTAEGAIDGSYELVLPAGVYELRGRDGGGGYTGPQRVTVPAGGTARMDLQIRVP